MKIKIGNLSISDSEIIVPYNFVYLSKEDSALKKKVRQTSHVKIKLNGA